MILMVDNYDSFTYNLVQAFAAAGAEVTVLRNDAESAEAMLARRPAGIVLSPGPGRPEGAGICLDLLARRPAVPLLGVCLGHQALGVAFGAEVDAGAGADARQDLGGAPRRRRPVRRPLRPVRGHPLPQPRGAPGDAERGADPRRLERATAC